MKTKKSCNRALALIALTALPLSINACTHNKDQAAAGGAGTTGNTTGSEGTTPEANGQVSKPVVTNNSNNQQPGSVPSPAPLSNPSGGNAGMGDSSNSPSAQGSSAGNSK